MRTVGLHALALLSIALLLHTGCGKRKEESGRPKISYGSHYFLFDGGFWEWNGGSDSEVWLKMPDGQVAYVPEISRAVAEKLLRQAKVTDEFAGKSDDVMGHRDIFYNMWNIKLVFQDEADRLRRIEVMGGFGEDGVVEIGPTQDGPFIGMTGADLPMTTILQTFGDHGEVGTMPYPRGV